jgi:hypothetical protein
METFLSKFDFKNKNIIYEWYNYFLTPYRTLRYANQDEKTYHLIKSIELVIFRLSTELNETEHDDNFQLANQLIDVLVSDIILDKTTNENVELYLNLYELASREFKTTQYKLSTLINLKQKLNDSLVNTLSQESIKKLIYSFEIEISSTDETKYRTEVYNYRTAIENFLNSLNKNVFIDNIKAIQHLYKYLF